MCFTYQLALNRESVMFIAKQEKTVQERIRKSLLGLTGVGSRQDRRIWPDRHDLAKRSMPPISAKMPAATRVRCLHGSERLRNALHNFHDLFVQLIDLGFEMLDDAKRRRKRNVHRIGHRFIEPRRKNGRASILIFGSPTNKMGFMGGI